ncbi:hypothetical protein RHMOL_Rhmol05G0319000 [Rhododendron molle]|uniref:Uncharacterized protein n=1 Tax=Rhododendron molle TaxID=49168 RepID=A0ACC0NV21_RHOML|nr:hypothetical protein RHMOL_Rhmol05G0319000 [Rhododendron molle]
MDDDGLEGNIEDNGELLNERTPRIGMEFESEEVAFQFYNEYGGIRGFSIRRDTHTKSKKDGLMINRKFVCRKEGEKEKDKRCSIVLQPRQETRTKRTANLYISFNRDSMKWEVKKFDDVHNHLLHLPETAYLMSTQRNLCESQALNIEIANAAGLSLKLSHDFLSAQVGGPEFVGFTIEDHKTYLRGKRQRDLQYGEAGALLRYFQQAIDNPYFYHEIQLDVDEMITNVFWADHQMITDYGIFGDALSFDTTFRTNKEYRPLGVFTGFNHYRMTVVFGVALLYDETMASFEWLFRIFLKAMSGKKPLTIFTDQDQAMANAISQVMPEVSHGLCTFHIMQNALKHLGYLFKDDSNFSRDFKACIYGYEDESELCEAWDSLICKYNLENNSWMTQTWKLRNKWAHVHMKWSFSAGMRSTQVSESLNAKLKKHLKSDLNIVDFFTHFNKVVIEKRIKERNATFDSREKLPKMKFQSSPMLAQASKLYTPKVFELFHAQFDVSLACTVENFDEVGGEFSGLVEKVGEGREYTVVGNVKFDELGGGKTCQEIRCDCRNFESFGILCGHAIRMLQRMNVMEVPEKYVLGRWRLDAKGCSSKEHKVIEDEDDPKLMIARRFRNLCPRMVNLAARSSKYDAAYKLVDETIRDLCTKVDNMIIAFGDSSSEGHMDVELDVVNPNLKRAKGFKKKADAVKGRVRLKPWCERIAKRKKVVSRSRLSKDPASVPIPSKDQPQDEIPYFPQMAPSSSQASYTPQFSQGIAFEQVGHTFMNEASHNGSETEPFFANDSFFDLLRNSQPSDSA